MKRSESVMEWQAEAKIEAKVGDVIKVLELRFGVALPAELEQRIRASKDLKQLDRWHATAVQARTLNRFRQNLDG